MQQWGPAEVQRPWMVVDSTVQPIQIVEMVGLSYPTVRNVIDLFANVGWSAPRRPGPGTRARQAAQ
jgi:hypothetical protein